MKRLHAVMLLGPLLLSGCGGTKEAPSARDDAQWDQAMTAGQDSLIWAAIALPLPSIGKRLIWP